MKIINNLKPTIMKNYLSILFVFVLMALTSCQTEQKAAPVNKDAVEEEIITALDALYSLNDTHDIEAYDALLCDDGLFLGSDSKEFWNKSDIMESQKKMLENPDFKFTFKRINRVVRIAEDGKSALVVDQVKDISVFGPDLPVRLTLHLIKTENKWKIDFWEVGLIPNNEDLPKIAAAITK
jgi:hypothetical protein